MSEHTDDPTGTPLDASGGPGAVGSDPEATPEAAVEAAAEAAAATPKDPPPEASGGGGSAAGLVAAGIFASRVIGLIRDRAIGYFFGVGAFSDVYRLGLRAPNLLQNLLGEGTLSAAFIPIYSRMTEEGREEDAARFAGAVLGLLTVVSFSIALLGVIFADSVVAVLQPGWINDADLVKDGQIPINRYDLAVMVVRLAFPMTAVLVLSAWALGVLNSHRKFLLSYFAPVAWNVAWLVALAIGVYLYLDDPLNVTGEAFPPEALSKLLVALFIGGIAGGVLQLVVQLPTVLRLLRLFRPSLSLKIPGVREGVRAFVPVVLGRGAYQLSGYLDVFLSSFLAAGALAALSSAQTLYLLPISLFGMSVAASELPELSRISRDELSTFLVRVRSSLGQILYLVVPTVVGYLAFGYLVVGVLYQTGQFGAEDTWLVYFVLAAYTIGLAATTASRLLQNAFYALDDTKTPARIAVWRVVISGVVGSALMIAFDRSSVFDVVSRFGISGVGSETRSLQLGAVGLALGSAAGGWIELWRLVRALRTHAPEFSLPWARAFRMAGLALAAALPAGLVQAFVPLDRLPIWVSGAVVLAIYGFGYLALGHLFGFAEGDAWTGRFLRRFKRS